MQLGLEQCNRYETHLLNTGAQTVSLIERIGEPNVVIHPDIARALAVWRPVAPGVEAMVVYGLGFIRQRAAAHGLIR